jgi:hypothetical protein
MVQIEFVDLNKLRILHNVPTFCSENLKERDHSEDLGIDGKIILE